MKKTPVASSLFSGTPPFLRADDIFGSYLDDDDEHYVGEYTSHREIDQGAILLARLTAGATISPARTPQLEQHNKPQRQEACPWPHRGNPFREGARLEHGNQLVPSLIPRFARMLPDVKNATADG